jgi:phage-related minor tail protein
LTDIAKLGVSIETGGLVTGEAALDSFSAAAASATAAEAELAAQSKSTSSAIAAQGASVNKTAASLSAAAASQEAAARSGQHFISTLKEQSALFGKSTQDVLRYRAAQLGVADAAEPIIAQLQQQRAAQDAAATAALKEATAQQAAAQAKRAAEAQQTSFLANLREQTALQGKSQVEILRYRAAQLGVTKEAETYIQQVERSNNATHNLGMSAKQTAFAMRLLPAQITDIVTSLASGSPAYLVAIQQGGQIRDSFGGFGNALKGIGALINPVTLAITGIGAAIGGVIAITAKAQAEEFGYAKALIFTGNAAGATVDQLRQMSEEIDDIAGTQTAAASALTALASTGQVAASNLKQFAVVAQRLKETVGKPVEETVKEFEQLGRTPLEASKRLNQQYNYLTASVYSQIKALEQQGRVQEAAALAQKTYAESQAERVGEAQKQVGYLQRAWKGVANAVKEAGDSLLSIGRTSSVERQLKDLQAERQRIQESSGSEGPQAGSGFAIRLAAIAKQEQALKQQAAAEKEVAEAKRASIEQTRLQIESEDRLKLILDARLQRDLQLQSARSNADDGAIQNNLSKQLAQFAAYDASIEGLRSADLIQTEKYYAKKRELIESETQARVKALQQQNALIRQENQLAQASAAAQINRLEGPDKEPERIRIQGAADAKVIEGQAKIRDNEEKMFELRSAAATQIKTLSSQQVASIESIVRALQDETDELRLQAELGDRAAEAIEKLRRSKALDRAGADATQRQRVEEAETTRDVEKDAGVIAARQEEIRLIRLGDQERRREAASRALSGAATEEQIQSLQQLNEQSRIGDLFNEQFESIKREFDTFSSDYVLSYNDMYDEVEARLHENVITEQEAAHARGLIAKAETQERVYAMQTLFGGLESLMSTKSKTLFRIGKSAALANATVSAAEAISNAYATKPWYLGLAQGISAAAILASQISSIRDTQMQGFMTGGYTGNSPSTQVAGVVHGREYVMDAASTARIGVENLNAMRSGKMGSFEASPAANNSNYRPINFSIYDYSTGAKTWEHQITADEVRFIARDEAGQIVQKQTPKIFEAAMSEPNSKISKAISKNTQAPRRRA